MDTGEARSVALLRGINVGRAKRIAMADLRKLVAGLGFEHVQTLLNSGNIVFSHRGMAPEQAAARIAEALVLKLGVAARVTVLTGAELAALMTENPLLDQATDHARLLVFVLNQAADRARLAALAAQDWAPEAFALGQRVAYLWCPQGVLDSAAATALGKLLGDAVTARNWNTMQKLHTLALHADA